MAKKTTKIKFIRDYSPRKKGEVAELETSLAEFYLNNDIAELNGASAKNKGGCEGCNEVDQLKKDLAAANKTIKTLKLEIVAAKKPVKTPKK